MDRPNANNAPTPSASSLGNLEHGMMSYHFQFNPRPHNDEEMGALQRNPSLVDQIESGRFEPSCWQKKCLFGMTPFVCTIIVTFLVIAGAVATISAVSSNDSARTNQANIPSVHTPVVEDTVTASSSSSTASQSDIDVETFVSSSSSSSTAASRRKASSSTSLFKHFSSSSSSSTAATRRPVFSSTSVPVPSSTVSAAPSTAEESTSTSEESSTRGAHTQTAHAASTASVGSVTGTASGSKKCPAEVLPLSNTVTWPETDAGVLVTRDCQQLGYTSQYVGKATRQCTTAGVWGDLFDDCKMGCSATTEEAQSENGVKLGAVWPLTEWGVSATIACPTGYTGKVTRQCLDQWQPVKGVCTQSGAASTGSNTALFCPKAQPWPQTAAGSVASISCISAGYTQQTGTVTQECQADGTWSGKLTTNCVDVAGCASESNAQSANGVSLNADWPATTPGETVTLSCPSGAGTVSRACVASSDSSASAWSAVIGNCDTA